jgi:hypothetical protein
MQLLTSFNSPSKFIMTAPFRAPPSCIFATSPQGFYKTTLHAFCQDCPSVCKSTATVVRGKQPRDCLTKAQKANQYHNFPDTSQTLAGTVIPPQRLVFYTAFFRTCNLQVACMQDYYIYAAESSKKSLPSIHTQGRATHTVTRFNDKHSLTLPICPAHRAQTVHVFYLYILEIDLNTLSTKGMCC